MDLPSATRILPTKTEIFEINYADVDSLQATVSKALTPDVGVVRADKRSKRIIVTDMPNKFDEIRTIIKEFDAKTKQVFIEARIIQINLDDEFNMGVDWEFLMRKATYHGLNIKGLFPIASTATQYTSIKYGTLGTDDYTGTVKLLDTFGRTKTLSTPHIAVVDGGEAKILIGTREAYITSQVTQGETTTTTSESVTFIDVGVSLNVTASINKDGFVSMKVKPEVSSVSRTLTTSQGNEIPIVETSEAETTVLVKDGATMIIAGLMKDRSERTVKTFPFLGKLPILGSLLSSTADSKIKTEIVVFLTPHIVTGEETLAPIDIRGKDRMPLKE
jgi:general secretion pathway protein D